PYSSRHPHSFPTRRSSDLYDQYGSQLPDQIRMFNQNAAQERCSKTECYIDQTESDKEEKCMEYRSCIEFFIFHFIEAHPCYVREDRKSTRLNSSHVSISYA